MIHDDGVGEVIDTSCGMSLIRLCHYNWTSLADASLDRPTLAPGCAISAPTLHVPWDQGYISTVYMGVMGYLGVMCTRELHGTFELHIIKVLCYILIFYVIFPLLMPLLLSCFGYPLKWMAYFLYFSYCPSKAVRKLAQHQSMATWSFEKSTKSIQFSSPHL